MSRRSRSGRRVGIVAATGAMLLGIGVVGAPAAPAAPVAESRPYVVTLVEGAEPSAVAAALAKANRGSVTHVFRHALRGFSLRLPTDRLTAIQQDPRVLSVEPDRVFTRAAEMTQRITTGIDRIEADRSSTRSGDGQGIVPVNVAVIDDGVDATHPDLDVFGGVSCIGSDPIHPPLGAYHGTAVAGSIASRDNAIGTVGVAPGARIYAVQSMNVKGLGSTSDIICGIDAVTATRLDADPTNDIQVANMSLAGAGPDKDGSCARGTKDAHHRAICRSIAAGVVYVVAAGNENKDFARLSPATYDEVLTVTATTETDGIPGGIGPLPPCEIDRRGGAPHDTYRDDRYAEFSNHAETAADAAHTVAAPGVCRTLPFPVHECTTPEDPSPVSCYGVGTGTSFATPVVAGLVALCIGDGACAGLSPGEIVAKIVNDAAAANATDPDYGYLGDPARPVPKQFFGWLVDASRY